MAGLLPWRETPQGMRLVVRVTPSAASDRIDGVEVRTDGAAVLSLRVRAAPERGRANAAVAALLCKALGVPKSAVVVVTGETARLKILDIAGDRDALVARLAALAR